MQLELWFPGEIKSKDNAKAFSSRNNRFFLPKEFKQWEEKIRWQFHAQKPSGFKTMVGPMKGIIEFCYPTHTHHDLSNCPKSLLDALNGLAYEDDRNFIELHLFLKLKSDEPGIRVTLIDAYKGEN